MLSFLLLVAVSGTVVVVGSFGALYVLGEKFSENDYKRHYLGVSKTQWKKLAKPALAIGTKMRSK